MAAHIDLEAESTLTDRYRTKVPEAVRRVLKLGKPMDTRLQERLQRLTGGIDVDLEHPLQDDDE